MKTKATKNGGRRRQMPNRSPPSKLQYIAYKSAAKQSATYLFSAGGVAGASAGGVAGASAGGGVAGASAAGGVAGASAGGAAGGASAGGVAAGASAGGVAIGVIAGVSAVGPAVTLFAGATLAEPPDDASSAGGWQPTEVKQATNARPSKCWIFKGELLVLRNAVQGKTAPGKSPLATGTVAK